MIYTFYSYKGGVGRSMALANVAELLLQRGLKVLMIDWDLEAPGLERYFSLEREPILQQCGVVDLIQDYQKALAAPDAGERVDSTLSLPDLSNYRCQVYRGERHPMLPGELWLMPAGRRSGAEFARYAYFVKTFNWQAFYQEWEGESFFEWFRGQVDSWADVVLIDSRTGVTELGGICTYQLADAIVMFCAPGSQILDGTEDMAAAFMEPEVVRLRGDRPLRVLVVPARVEDRAEARDLTAFQEEFTGRFGQRRFSGERSLAATADAMWDLKIPHVPYYAFREEIVVRDPDDVRHPDIYEAFRRLADAMGALPGANWPDPPPSRGADGDRGSLVLRIPPTARRVERDDPSIPAYLSHSFRPTDRDVNLHFWERFWEAGFTVTVEPAASARLSIPRLELMMRQSACFVAVMPHRPEQSRYRTSPYMVFEYGMAVRAGMPRLVVAEQGVAGWPFDAPDTNLSVFRRRDLATTKGLEEMLAELRHLCLPHAHRPLRLLGSVGVILPPGPTYARIFRSIREILEASGYVVDVLPFSRDEIPDARGLDDHDFMVADIGARATIVELHRRFVPTIRLGHVDADDRRPSLPQVLGDEALDHVTGDEELVLWWRDEGTLVTRLQREVEGMQRPRRQFASWEEGASYFASLGRSRSARVFISNATSQNELARDLCRALDLNNISYFHFAHSNTIEPGMPWAQAVHDQLRGSGLFVCLVSRNYFGSPSCRSEFEHALELAKDGQLRVYPYFLEEPHELPVLARSIQGRDLAGMSPDGLLTRIVEDIDNYLTAAPSS